MSRSIRFLVLLLLYGVVATVSYWLSWKLRFGFYKGIDGLPERFRDLVIVQGLYMIPFKLFCLYALGQFSGLVRFFRLPDAIRLLIASSLATFVFLVVWVVSSYQYVPPGSILLVDFFLFTSLVVGLRVGIRILDERRKGFLRNGKKLERVAIVGAGQAGSALVSELISQPELGMRPVIFFDDSKVKHGRQLHGIPIAGAPEQIPSYFSTHDLDKVILAIPSASPERLRAVVSLFKQHKIPVETVPSVGEIVSGNFRASQTREVNIEDLLYRDPVEIDPVEIHDFVGNHVVLLTGAGGSIGQELASQLAGMEPSRLVIVDRCESALFLTEKMLLDSGTKVPVETRVADVKNTRELRQLFEAFRPSVIYHAAAHKHVGMMERQPMEAFLNNALGTYEFAKLAVEYSVQSFCLISTDKAVYPTSVMGASKRLAELAIQALVELDGSGETDFSIVRFGNVIGSSGSVIPIFEKQIDRGGPLTVTDRLMTRYFMTIPEAVGLVLQASSFREKNALFVLDMGKPVRIDDVARDLIRLKGLEPDVDIEIIYTGARPGEKMEEVLQYEDETLLPTKHSKISRIASAVVELSEPSKFLDEFQAFHGSETPPSSEVAKVAMFNLLANRIEN
ncbi:MAG: polysaccharide biosynthesis protein [Opitutaceae bacterium]